VYEYWAAKRRKWGKPLMRRLQAPTNPSDANPYNVFRCVGVGRARMLGPVSPRPASRPSWYHRRSSCDSHRLCHSLYATSTLPAYLSIWTQAAWEGQPAPHAPAAREQRGLPGEAAGRAGAPCV